jgi:nicotinamide mononucleotide (NMN) deamidase PncC
MKTEILGPVCIVVARRGGPIQDVERHYPPEDRDCIRRRAITDALTALIVAATEYQKPPDDGDPSSG